MLDDVRHQALPESRYKGMLVTHNDKVFTATCMASGCGASYETPASYTEQEQAALVQDWVTEHQAKHILRLI